MHTREAGGRIGLARGRHVYPRFVLRRVCLLVIAGILSGFAFLLVTGDYSNDGPTLVELGRNQGVHLGDLFVMSGWAVGILALVTLGLAGHPSGTSRAASRILRPVRSRAERPDPVVRTAIEDQ